MILKRGDPTGLRHSDIIYMKQLKEPTMHIIYHIQFMGDISS
jgi:hypothetical protein